MRFRLRRGGSVSPFDVLRDTRAAITRVLHQLAEAGIGQ
jgi:hypothetical protein